MKRLRQTLTVLCLLLSLATAALWVRSAGRGEYIRYQRTTLTATDASACVMRWGRLMSHRGRIQLLGGRADYNRFNPVPLARIALDDGWSYGQSPFYGYGTFEGVLGFAVGSVTWSDGSGPGGSYRGTQTVLQFPHWFLVLLLAVPPAIAVVRRLRRRRRDPNARPCPACGYDLRASPTRCPECGHAAAVAT